MDKGRKKNIKRVISLILIVALVGFLAAMPLLAEQQEETKGPEASILSGTVETGSIRTQVIGGGTLAQDEGTSLNIHSAVKLTSYLVSDGDSVTEGQAVATVDRVSVMNAISKIQETLDILSEQIQEEGSKEKEQEVSALAGGIVKELYCQEGDSVQEVMLNYGALAILSLDGKMAVDLTVESTLAVGESVTLTLSDGTQATGKVEKNLAGELTVTVEDDAYPVGDAVDVSDSEGTLVGSGELYIYNPWSAMAYTGTVGTVEVAEGDSLEPGEVLMELTEVGDSAAYRQLVAQRQAYEDLMLELFQMYQTQELTAPCDGVITGLEENSPQLLSATEGGFVLELLANAPNGEEEGLYLNYAAMVTTVASNGWVLSMDPEAVAVEDYFLLSELSLDKSRMTVTALHTQMDLPVYTLEEGVWVQLESASILPGDVLIFATDGEGALVWAVLVERAPEESDKPEDPTEPSQPEDPAEPDRPGEPSQPDQPDQPGEPGQPGVPSDPTEPGQSTTPTEPGQTDTPDQPGQTDTPTQPGQSGNQGSGTFPGGSTSGSGGTVPGGSTSGGSGSFPNSGSGSQPNFSYPSGGSTGGSFGSNFGGSMSGTVIPQQEEEVELYGMDVTQIATITPQNTVTMEITVDELDISSLYLGMPAQVRIDALGGEKYEATITHIGNSGTSNGGNSKFTVELTMERGENMLAGMSATAKITLDTTEAGMTVPADALVERGNETLIYTAYDEENQCLMDPVAVIVGTSDGETVEILEGLSQGQKYYYAYYDKLEISYTPDFGGGGFNFGR